MKPGWGSSGRLVGSKILLCMMLLVCDGFCLLFGASALWVPRRKISSWVYEMVE